MAFRVKDAKAAHERALKLGASQRRRRSARWSSTSRRSRASAAPHLSGRPLRRADDLRRRLRADRRARARPSELVGLTYLDHLTHNVFRGNMAKWADFYERIFNFREIRYFDIEGKQTGLFSKAMTSPAARSASRSTRARTTRARSRNSCATTRARASSTSRSAPTTSTQSVEALRDRGVQFQDTPDTYFERHRRSACPATARTCRGCRSDRILIDGAPTRGPGPAAADLHRERDRPDLLRD